MTMMCRSRNYPLAFVNLIQQCGVADLPVRVAFSRHAEKTPLSDLTELESGLQISRALDRRMEMTRDAGQSVQFLG